MQKKKTASTDRYLLLLLFVCLTILGLNVAFDATLTIDEIILINTVALPICYPLGYLIAARERKTDASPPHTSPDS